MTVQVARPDDLELLRRAGRNLRRIGKVPVVFGGLGGAAGLGGDRGERGIRVTTTSGAQTARLTTIVVRPGLGLGGHAWSSGHPEAVSDYARAVGITHEFDPQVLGEGIVGLAVAPIVVRNRISGLLYAGYRSELRRDGILDLLDLLGREAGRVAEELLLRELVDERVAATQIAAALPAAAHPDVAELFARLRRLAAQTSDPETARELRELVAGGLASGSSGSSGSSGLLTARQVDVLALVALGMTNERVGASLGLSVLTVKSYLRSAMVRLGAQTRYQAVVEARRLGVLP